MKHSSVLFSLLVFCVVLAAGALRVHGQRGANPEAQARHAPPRTSISFVVLLIVVRPFWCGRGLRCNDRPVTRGAQTGRRGWTPRHPKLVASADGVS